MNVGEKKGLSFFPMEGYGRPRESMVSSVLKRPESARKIFNKPHLLYSLRPSEGPPPHKISEHKHQTWAGK